MFDELFDNARLTARPSYTATVPLGWTDPQLWAKATRTERPLTNGPATRTQATGYANRPYRASCTAASITAAHDWESFVGVVCGGIARPEPDAAVAIGTTAR